MSNNPKPDSKPDKQAPSKEETIGQLWKLALAHADAPRAATITNPSERAGVTIGKLTGVASPAVADRIQQEAAAISAGQLDVLEHRLAAQAITLDTLFHQLTQTAHRSPISMESYSSYLKLALRAQAQSAQAMAALAAIKQPPQVILAKQLNAAQQQIVNNNTPSPAPTAHAGPQTPQPTALPQPSPIPDYAQMDTRGPRQTEPANQKLDPVDKIHRPAN